VGSTGDSAAFLDTGLDFEREAFTGKERSACTAWSPSYVELFDRLHRACKPRSRI
jgi:hypothetical protein